MKLSRIALAALAIAAGNSFAAPAVLSGASAFSVNQIKALKGLCSGNFILYKGSSSTSALSNFATAKCSVNFTGAPGIDEVRLNVSGGSYSAVTNRSGNTGATSLKYINPTLSGTCTNLAAGNTMTGILAFLNPLVTSGAGTQVLNCGSNRQYDDFSIGGFMDIEGDVFRGIGAVPIPPEVDDTVDFVGSNFAQGFGVGLSAPLYQALQAYQVAQGTLDASCATTSVSGSVTTYTGVGGDSQLCQPSVTRAQLTSLMEASDNKGKQAGANLLVGGTASVKNDLPATKAISPDVPLGSRITFCRRVDTSGTNAATQVYFLSNPTASGESGGRLAIGGVGNAQGDADFVSKTDFFAGGGTGDARNCVNLATPTAAAIGPSGAAYGSFRFAVLSLENNPIGTDNYRFAKINGVAGADGVANAAMTANSIAGLYDFWFEAIKYCPGGTCAAIIDAIDGGVAPGASTPGIFLKSETRFTRLGNNLGPITSKP